MPQTDLKKVVGSAADPPDPTPVRLVGRVTRRRRISLGVLALDLRDDEARTDVLSCLVIASTPSRKRQHSSPGPAPDDTATGATARDPLDPAALAALDDVARAVCSGDVVEAVGVLERRRRRAAVTPAATATASDPPPCVLRLCCSVLTGGAQSAVRVVDPWSRTSEGLSFSAVDYVGLEQDQQRLKPNSDGRDLIQALKNATDPPAAAAAPLSLDECCKEWINTRRCSRGDACPRAHPAGDDLHRVRQADAVRRRERREAKRAAIAAVQPPPPTTTIAPADDTAHDRRANPSNHGVAGHGQRAEIFANFVAQTFFSSNHTAAANDGEADFTGGVIDVAGGRGDLSHALRARLGCPTLIVDPRDPRPTKAQLRAAKRRKSQHPKIGGGGGDATEHKTAIQSHPTQTQTLTQAQEPPPRLPHLRELFDRGFAARHPETVRGCRLVVALHPDEATEPAVDVALANRIPFAVVPCCVFSGLFPDRVNSRGERVRSYESFVAYLAEKHPNCETAVLPVDGMNKVVFLRKF
jgi:hypothetical protein